MTDLTVLISPIPLGPEPSTFSFGRRSTRPLNKPIMVTLETEVDEDSEERKSPTTESQSPISHDFLERPVPHQRRSRTPRVVEPNLLSPPVNTWKSRPKHRPTRSQSAPPERRVAPPRNNVGEGEQEVSETETETSPVFNRDSLGFKPRNPNRSFTSFTVNRQTTQGGELVRPPPPLFRPTTFWRKTPRSGVTGASYSPATHLIRRSTYIAAGLTFDAPVHDLSALPSDCPNDRKSCLSLSPRQQTPTPTTDTSGSASTTFDFWWPFPLATTGSTSTTTPASSSSQATTTTLQSSSTNTPTSSANSNSPSQSTTSPSLSLPISNSNTSSKPTFNIIDAIPFISAGGILLLGLAIWLIYGCCTRRPRIRTGRDDGELVCGPPYRNDDGDGERLHRDVDVEERARAQNQGQDQENELMIPKRGHYHHRKPSRDHSGSGQYRWPSYNEPPRFDSSAGFYIPDEYKELEGDEDFLNATLLAPPPPRDAAKRNGRSSKSKAKASRTKHSPSPISEREAPSVALLSLYESEDEDEEKAKVPWESLRHKSIKRGILEQVHKEERWMDSVRSSITRARGSAMQESVSAKNHEHEREDEGEEEVVGMGKRRGHFDNKPDSDIFLGPSPVDARTQTQPIATNDILTAGPSGYESSPHIHTHIQNTSYTTNEAVSVHPTTDRGQTVTSASASAPGPGPGVRHTFVQLKDDPQDLDRYTPIPTRTTPSRGESRSRSRSRGRNRSRGPTRHRNRNRSDGASPVKSSLHKADDRHEEQEKEKSMISRDVLPSSPPQLMSPPLESQICFTPPLRPNEFGPPLSFSLLGPAQVQVQPTTTTKTKASRAEGSRSPTKIPTPRKSRKLHSSTPPRLPFPGSGGRGGGTGTVTPGPRQDAYRGRLLKKQKSSSVNAKGAGGPPAAATRNDAMEKGDEGDAECDEAMRKVDKIIQSSWGARD